MIVRSILLSLFLTLSGCAAMEPRLGFDEVSTAVSERAGLEIRWITGGPEDLEARRAVSGLLAEELTADDAVQIALLNNRDLQAAYEDLHIAQADLVQAGLLRNPIFDAAARFPTEGSGVGVDLGVAQDFLSIFFIPLRKARAGAAFEAAKLRVSGEVLDMASEVRRAFYELQAAEQRVEMGRTAVLALEASYEIARRLHEAGNIRDLDLSNERAVYEEAKLTLSRLEADALMRREQMNELMGLWGEQTAWRAAPRLPALPDEDPSGAVSERLAVERSLDLGILRRNIETTARTLGIAGPLAAFDDAEIGAEAEREIEGEWSVGPSVAVPIPLFDQGQGAIGRARAELRQQNERMWAMAVRIRSRARALSAAAESARERARYYETVLLPLRQRIVDETQLQYNAMQVSPLQLLQAKRDQIAAGAAYIDALRDYWVVRARLDQLRAGRLGPLGTAGEPSETGASTALQGGGGH